MHNPITDTGLSVVYAPDEGDPLLDIVIVHGLQGHPFKTWASTKISEASLSPCQSSLEASRGQNKGSGIVRRMVSKVSTRHSVKSASGSHQVEPSLFELSIRNGKNKAAPVFWPADLAPEDCPRSRILVYGYDTKVSKYMAGPTNKNTVFSHGKDLVYAICRERAQNRPLVFLAHSLGGIVVKEALAASSASRDADVHNIVCSTAAVIFLGTPHRGSPDLSAIGEWARSALSLFRVETTSAILDTLGLKTSDLERAQESFSGLWQKYDFRVKTFQEGLGLTGFHLGVLGNKVVPDYSSSLGDHRERSETLQANHMEMCRFTGSDDPNYRKLAGEFRSIYRSIQKMNRLRGPQAEMVLRQSLDSQPPSLARDENNDKSWTAEKLGFPTMNLRYRSIPKPALSTCSWIFEHEKYQDWFQGRNIPSHGGLLVLMGKPGAGKSVLMKEIYSRLSLGQTEFDYSTAAFFFHAQGEDLEHSMNGMLRSLLFQLLPKSWFLDHFNSSWEYTYSSMETNDLKALFAAMLVKPSSKRIFIFIDALDECDSSAIRDTAYFWRDVTERASASGNKLNVLMSTRHFPTISLSNSSKIIVEDHTKSDIESYIQQKIKLVASPTQDLSRLKTEFCLKSNGVFLWTVLTLDKMLQEWDEGLGVSTLIKRMDTVPLGLEALFVHVMSGISPEARRLTFRLFQWASLTVKPLRLHEWHHILAFIRRPVLRSLCDWRESEYFTETDDQLERQIRSLSRGLLEVRSVTTAQDNTLEVISVLAGAGSLDISCGETRAVQFIHESARDFFLQGQGFSILDSSACQPRAEGHLSIMMTCLDYLSITELDALVKARERLLQHTSERRAFLEACEQCRSGKTRCDGAKPCKRCTDQRFPCHWKVGSYSKSFQDKIDVSQQYISSSQDYADPAKVPESLEREASSVDTGRNPSKAQRAYRGHGTKSLYQHSFFSPRQERESVLDLLRESSAIASGVDVSQWIITTELLLSENTLSESASNSVALSATSGRTQVLQDYPALLSYATQELFSHAKLADVEHANPTEIIRRLRDEKLWDRWLLLSEAADPELTLEDFAIKKNLSSWISIFRPAVSEAPVSEDVNVAQRDNNRHDRPRWDEDLFRPPGFEASVSEAPVPEVPVSEAPVSEAPVSENVSVARRDYDLYDRPRWNEGDYRERGRVPSSLPAKTAGRKRQRSPSGSVASFGSAGSHTGSIYL